MSEEIDWLQTKNRRLYTGSTDRLSIDKPDLEIFVCGNRIAKESRYGVWAKSKDLKPIMKYKGVRKVKARLRKKKAVCVGALDKDGCYHIHLGIHKFNSISKFFSGCLSYNKKLRKVRKFKRR